LVRDGVWFFFTFFAKLFLPGGCPATALGGDFDGFAKARAAFSASVSAPILHVGGLQKNVGLDEAPAQPARWLKQP